MNPDVAIVGAGSAGLFAALELAEKSSLKILVVDCGNAPTKRFCLEQSYKGCTKCSPCHILCGIGGAGTLSEMAFACIYHKPLVCLTSIPGWSQEIGARGSLDDRTNDVEILTAKTGKNAVRKILKAISLSK